MSKQAITSADAPAAIGPYSQAVRVGNFVYCSGQVGKAAGAAKLEGDLKQQTRQVLENLKAVLAAAGLGMADVVKTTVFLTDMNDFAAMNEIYAEYLAPAGVVPPARSTIQVAGLPLGAIVEIDVVAEAN